MSDTPPTPPPTTPLTAFRVTLTVEIDPTVLDKSYLVRMAEIENHTQARGPDIDTLVSALEAKFSEKLPDILAAIKLALGLPL